MKKPLDYWIDYWNIRKIPSLELESMIPKLILIPLMKSTTNGTLSLLSCSLISLGPVHKKEDWQQDLIKKWREERYWVI